MMMKHLRFAAALIAAATFWSAAATAVTVNFTDPDLEAAVRAAFDDLGSPLGETIDSADLVGVGFTTLVANDSDISSLGGLEFATDLQVLDLSFNEISDLTPLSSLTNLIYLDLGTGSPVEELLPEDPVEANLITNIAPLAPLDDLVYLNLAGNFGLTNISTLSSLPSIELLVLAWCDIASFTPIASLVNLQRCIAVDVGMTDVGLANFATLTDLLTLVISENEITTLDSLIGLTNLETLIADQNQISDISVIATLPNLSALLLSFNQITDLTPVADNVNIGGADIIIIEDNPFTNQTACEDVPVILARFTTGIFATTAFCLNETELTISVVGTGTTNPAPGVVNYIEGQEATVIAFPVAGSGFAFERWQGDVVSTSEFINVDMSTDRAVEAVFVAGDHDLTVNVAGSGSGTVTPGTGTFSYLDGRPAFLFAEAAEGSTFAGWSGDYVSINASVAFPMDGDKTVTANFVAGTDTRALTIGIQGEGLVDPGPGVYNVPVGLDANVKATPIVRGWVFDRWEGDLGGADPSDRELTVTMDANRSVTAFFVPDGLDYTLSITVEGIGKTDPTEEPLFSRHLDGAEVEINAQTIADSGYAFSHWEGDLDSTNAFETIVMDSDKNLTAVFVTPGDHTLTIAEVGATGRIFPASGVHSFLDGQLATIAAFPQAGEFFGGWTGDITGVLPIQQVEMDADKTATATFSDQGFNLTLQISGQGATNPAPGVYPLALGSVVQLEAAAIECGWAFIGWTGDIGAEDPNAEIITVTIDQARTITANFSADVLDYELDIEIVGIGNTNPPPDACNRYAENETVVVNPVGIPGSGFAFDRWMGDINNTIEFNEIVMDGDKQITAVFTDQGVVDLTINTSGPGTTFPLPGVQSYVQGRTATLTSIPEPGKFFGGWSGAVTSLNPVINILMDADKTVTATYADTGVTLTVNITGEGSTDPNPGVYPITGGNFLSLTAFDTEPGWIFSEWQGDIGANEPTDRTISVFMGVDRNITAMFIPDPFDFELTLDATGPGTTDPAPGIYQYDDGQQQFVTAIPNEGAFFVEWQGDIGTNDPNSTFLFLTMDQNRSVTAVFDQSERQLTVELEGIGNVNPAPGISGRAQNEVVQLTATTINGSGFSFDRWEGDIGDADPNSPSITVTMDVDRTVTAIFLPVTTLTLATTGPGEITLNPGDITPADGAYEFNNNDVVTLTATATDSNFRFSRWVGDLGGQAGTQPEITLNMDVNRTVTAIFLEVHTLQISVQGSGTTQPLPGISERLEGQVVTITAIPAGGFKLDRWEGDIGEANPTNPILQVTMDQDRSVTAVFVEDTGEGEGEGGEGEGEGDGETPQHDGDWEGDGRIGLSELLKIIQIFNSNEYHCDPGNPDGDGYAAGPGPQDCTPHDADYEDPADWRFSLSELLRVIQIFNFGAYYPCPGEGTDDGFCLGEAP